MTLNSKDLTLEDHRLISKIAARAVRLYQKYGRKREMIDIILDLENVKCELDLQALFDADDGNFSHDIGGIHNHLDHETGELRDCFWPRFAKPSASAKGKQAEVLKV